MFEVFDRFISEICRSNYEIILLRDFDIDLLKTSFSTSYKLLSSALSFNMFPCIIIPTGVTDSSVKLIDKIFSTLMPYRALLSCLTSLTYFPCITNYSISGLHSVPSTPCNLPVRYQQYQFGQFKFRLSDTSWEFLTDSSQSVDSHFNRFYDLVKEAFVDSCCVTSAGKSSKHSVPRAPWMTATLLKNTKKTYLWKVFKSSNSHHHLEKYKKYRTLVISLIRKAKYMYYSQMFSKFVNIIRKTWQLVNIVLHPNSERNDLPNKLISKGVVITTSKVIMVIFSLILHLQGNQFLNIFWLVLLLPVTLKRSFLSIGGFGSCFRV